MSAEKRLTGRAQKSVFALALTLCFSLKTGQSSAYVLPVIDGPALQLRITHLIEQYSQWAKTGVQYTEQLRHYSDTVRFWKTQLVKLKALRLQLVTVKQAFESIDPDYGVAERCPGASGGSVTDTLKKAVTSALSKSVGADGSLAARQNDVCVAIVRADNKKYNITVRYFEQLDVQLAELVKLEEMRLSNVGESPANMTALVGDTARYQAALAATKSSWEANMLQQNTEIELLRQQQSVLSRRMLNGSPSFVGTLINAAVLKAAFESH